MDASADIKPTGAVASPMRRTSAERPRHPVPPSPSHAPPPLDLEGHPPRFPSGLGGALSPTRSVSFRQPLGHPAPGAPGNSVLRDGEADGRRHLVVSFSHIEPLLNKMQEKMQEVFMGKLVEFKADILSKINKKLEEFSPEVKVDTQELIIIKNQGVDAERLLKRMTSTLTSIGDNVKKNAESSAALQAYHERDFEVMREDVMNAKADEARCEERIEAARREGFAQGEKEGEKRVEIKSKP
jgi:hypothetical protein